jgi:MGT family glycosyltransferase
MRRTTSKLRQRYGLTPLEHSVVELSTQVPLTMVPSCPEFDYQRRDLPPSVKYVGPCLWYPPAKEASDWLTELPQDRPTVYVTEGTLYAQKPVVLRAGAQGLANVPMNVILTTGVHRDPSILSPHRLASNVIVKQYVPHAELLPHVDVIVTHGGGGTVIGALSEGVPLIVVPLMWDQPENAQRVVQAGAGIQLSPRQCTPSRLRAAVEHVVGDPTYRQNARRLADSLHRYGGPPRVAELVEDLVSKQ